LDVLVQLGRRQRGEHDLPQRSAVRRRGCARRRVHYWSGAVGDDRLEENHVVTAKDAKVCCLAGRSGEFFQAWQGLLLQTGAAQHDLQGLNELVAEQVASGCLIVPDEVMDQECAQEAVQRAGLVGSVG
jgi:hypothetical protein